MYSLNLAETAFRISYTKLQFTKLLQLATPRSIIPHHNSILLVLVSSLFLLHHRRTSSGIQKFELKKKKNNSRFIISKEKLTRRSQRYVPNESSEHAVFTPRGSMSPMVNQVYSISWDISCMQNMKNNVLLTREGCINELFAEAMNHATARLWLKGWSKGVRDTEPRLRWSQRIVNAFCCSFSRRNNVEPPCYTISQFILAEYLDYFILCFISFYAPNTRVVGDV